MTIVLDDVIKLLLAVLIGGLIGAERECRDKAAGFRTIILICVGATLFTIFSLRMGGDVDQVRIAANIVSGVGFIGAGAILRDEGRITGLTTASTIWLAAALGIGIGGGYYLFCSAATGIVLIVLWLFPLFETLLGNVWEVRTYEVTCEVSLEKLTQLEEMFTRCALSISRRTQARCGGDMTCTWVAYGRPKNHDRLGKMLFADPEVKGFRF